MLKQDLKFAFRNIMQNKSYSAISILGLAIGMAVSFLILNYILIETNYESSQKNLSKIYAFYWSDKDKENAYGTSPYILSKIFRENYSSIAKCGQIGDSYSPEKFRIIWKDKLFPIDNIYYADPTALEILPIELIRGNKKTFEETTNSIYISEKLSRNIFNNDDVVGKQIQIRNENKDENFLVAGIFKNRPVNSHFQPDLIQTIDYNRSLIPPYFLENEWGMNSYTTYFQLNEGRSLAQLKGAFKSIKENHIPDYRKSDFMSLMPLKDIHLYSSYIHHFFGKRGSIEKVNLFTAIAFLILLIACINFINITTARSSLREKEYGIKKVLGAGKYHLFYQSLMESVLFALISLPFALLFVELIKPAMSKFLDRDLVLYSAQNTDYIIYILLLTILVGIFSGLYNAFNSLKQFSHKSFSSYGKVISTKSFLRRALISFQFVVFIGLLIGGIVINRQMNYMINSDLGYNKENYLIVDIPSDDQMTKVPSFIKELKQTGIISNASVASSLPPSVGNTLTSNIASALAPDKGVSTQFITCDENFASTLGLKLVEGSFYDDKSASDKVVINEIAAKKFGFDKAVNQQVIINDNKRTICGVVKNFYAQSLYKEALPLAMMKSESFLLKMAIRYKDGFARDAIKLVEKKWKEFFPDTIMKMSFSDDEFAKTYESDLRFSDTIYFFTVISLIISMVGLASTTAITTARRKKEIGVRKVLGASIKDILLLLSKEIAVISIISSALAVVIILLLINNWLETFAYRIEISWIYPAVAIVFGLLISLTIVVVQSLRTASVNPVESLRYE
ncbi:MAG: FtsX-like permease family protein [bacterium]